MSDAAAEEVLPAPPEVAPPPADQGADRNYTCIQYAPLAGEAEAASVKSFSAGPELDLQPGPSRVAVIVAHGMGQQVPFETIDGLGRRIRSQAQSTAQVAAGFLKGGDDYLVRAELEVKGKTVDVYEVYWAPLTQGNVQLKDVVSFLWDMAWRGVNAAGKGGKFERWMFGKWQQLPFNAVATILFFMLVALVFLCLTVINATAVVMAAGSIWEVVKFPTWLDAAMRARLTGLLSVFAGFGLLVALGFKAGGCGCLPKALSRAVMRFLVSALLAAVIVTGVFILLMITRPFGIVPGLTRLSGITWFNDATYQWGLWAAIAYLAVKGRWFILEFVGDVTAYVSSHTVNRYAEVRSKIQAIARKTGTAVYGAKDDQGRPLYDCVLVVGHSLGSVVAYDMLNALIRDDLINTSALQVRDRTRLFLTFGSPLNKTAYIFRTQQKQDAEIRESLAAAIQPMIADYRFRPDFWMNIHSPDDWISGSLTFYDEPGANNPRRVFNVEDRDATTPGAAHSEYWNNPLLAKILYDAIVDPGFHPKSYQ